MPHATTFVPCVHPLLEDALPQYGRLPLSVGDLEEEKGFTRNVLCGGKVREFPDSQSRGPPLASAGKIPLSLLRLRYN